MGSHKYVAISLHNFLTSCFSANCNPLLKLRSGLRAVGTATSRLQASVVSREPSDEPVSPLDRLSAPPELPFARRLNPDNEPPSLRAMPDRLIREVAATRWLCLREVTFARPAGGQGTWSYVTRQGEVSAVVIIARTAGVDPVLVLVEEYRPPLGRRVIAFPAGLVDAGETMEDAALRELREETGWEGELTRLDPPVYSSPGLTDECMAFAHVRLSRKVTARPEADEDIRVLTVLQSELKQRLEEWSKAGFALDAKLWAYAAAL